MTSEQARLARLRAATTTAREDARQDGARRHAAMVARLIEHPERPCVTYSRGGRAVTIRRGAHITHAASLPPRPAPTAVTVRAFSYGGGVQSTAALVLASQGKIDYRLFLYADVGENHEPETAAYVEDVAAPFASAHGLELLTVRRGGVNRSLLHKIERLTSSLPIPVRMDRTGAPGRRSCTQDFKIEPIARELKRRGATAAAPATVGLGITVDEIARVRSPDDPRQPTQTRDYPLVTLELTRQDCIRLIERAGVPVPPKSACYFCPFHSLEQWQELRRTRRDLFDKAAELEAMLQRRRADLGRDPVWLTDIGARHKIPLAQLVAHDQMRLDENVDNCDEGFCFT